MHACSAKRNSPQDTRPGISMGLNPDPAKTQDQPAAINQGSIKEGSLSHCPECSAQADSSSQAILLLAALLAGLDCSVAM